MALKVLFSFFVFVSALGFAPSAQADTFGRGCEECPIPMAEWLGSWWSDDAGLLLQFSRIPGSPKAMRVVLRDIVSNRIVADGIGILPTMTDTMKIKMRKPDGVSFVTSFAIQPQQERVLVTLPKWIGRSLNGHDLPSELYFLD